MAASQTFTVRSSPAEAMRRPSGLNATPLTPTGVPLERERPPGRWRRPRPSPCRRRLAEAIVRPSGLNATPKTPPVWPLRVERLLAGGGVPDLHRPIVAGRGEAAAVGAERHAA